MRQSLLLALAALAAGCVSAPRQTFEVEVVNRTTFPISAALTRHGTDSLGGRRSVPDRGWAAPEDVAIFQPHLSDRRWGTLIRPGESAILGPREGSFPDGSYAVLRVYAGDKTVEQYVSHSRGDPDRLDIPLWPGRGRHVIVYEGGRLASWSGNEPAR